MTDRTNIPPASGGESDPTQTLIVVADDGTFWRVTKEIWRQEANQINESGGLGVLQQLANFGTYLAYIPPDLSVGIGGICTLVNLKTILKNNDVRPHGPLEPGNPEPGPPDPVE